MSSIVSRVRLATSSTLLAAAFALSSPRAQASESFPAVFPEAGALCVPQCTICHINNTGGIGTVDKAFGKNLMAQGLTIRNDAKLKSQLTSLTSDVDMDGTSDLEELKAGTDPNDPASDAQICDGPQYGCGAHIARQSQTPGNEPLYAAIGFGLLGLGSVLRRRRH